MLRDTKHGIGLEYAVNLDAALCFPCRDFEREDQKLRCESTFAGHGYPNRKHATENNGVFPNIAPSKPSFGMLP